METYIHTLIVEHNNQISTCRVPNPETWMDEVRKAIGLTEWSDFVISIKTSYGTWSPYTSSNVPSDLSWIRVYVKNYGTKKLPPLPKSKSETEGLLSGKQQSLYSTLKSNSSKSSSSSQSSASSHTSEPRNLMDARLWTPSRYLSIGVQTDAQHAVYLPMQTQTRENIRSKNMATETATEWWCQDAMAQTIIPKSVAVSTGTDLNKFDSSSTNTVRYAWAETQYQLGELQCRIMESESLFVEDLSPIVADDDDDKTLVNPSSPFQNEIPLTWNESPRTESTSFKSFSSADESPSLESVTLERSPEQSGDDFELVEWTGHEEQN